MRVWKLGCGVKLFGFSRANHASTNLKKFSSSKLDKFTLFTHSFRRLKLGKSLQTSCVNFFRLSEKKNSFESFQRYTKKR